MNSIRDLVSAFARQAEVQIPTFTNWACESHWPDIETAVVALVTEEEGRIPFF